MVSQLVDKDSIALDIGVYLGVFANVMAKYAKKVYAFEPHPDHFRFSKSALPSNVEVINMALSNEDGEAKLFVPIKYPSAGKVGASTDRKDVKEYVIKKTTLDRFNYTKIGLIKIDAEGHEFEILHGAAKTIAANKPNMIIEIEQRHQKRNINEVFDYIKGFGYEGYFIDKDKVHKLADFTLDLQNIAHIGHPDYVNNFIFIPTEKISEWNKTVKDLI